MPHRRTTAALSLALVLVSSTLARADGKFYSREPVPPNIPYQRALLMYDDGTETLILQSKFKGTLTPAQMASDLELVPAADNEPYRERIVKW